MVNRSKFPPIGYALLAACLYALNAPFSKLLLATLPAAYTAGFLYLGAGAGMLAVGGIGARFGRRNETGPPLGKGDFPYVIPMILLDIIAPILLMLGLTSTSAASASLLNNFEIVATSLIAMLLFREKIPAKLWGAIGLITVSCVILSLDDANLSAFRFSTGSLLILAACLCWGMENNCTERLSKKDPLQIVVVKGIFSGIGSLATAYIAGERLEIERFGIPILTSVLAAMALGFAAYGLSIYFYIKAQRELGAAKTSAFYAVSPFIGGALSLIIYRQLPSVLFISAAAIMIIGTFLASGAKEGQ